MCPLLKMFPESMHILFTHRIFQSTGHSISTKSFLFLLLSCWVISNPLKLHGLQHASLLCPLSLGVCSNSCPLNWWCHTIISSFVTSFSSCPQFFPAPGSFPMSRFFTSGGHSIGASASATVLSMNIQGQFLLRLTGLISLQSLKYTVYIHKMHANLIRAVWLNILYLFYTYHKKEILKGSQQNIFHSPCLKTGWLLLWWCVCVK